MKDILKTATEKELREIERRRGRVEYMLFKDDADILEDIRKENKEAEERARRESLEAEKAKERAKCETAEAAQRARDLETGRVVRFEKLWNNLRGTTSGQVKNLVGMIYISRALGLGRKAAELFASENDQGVYHEVGLIQGGAKPYNGDFRRFWQEVKEIIPNIYSEGDLEFLVTDGAHTTAWHFLLCLGGSDGDSEVLGRLVTNAHVYK